MKKLAIVIYLIFSTSFTPIAAKFVVNQISPLSLAFIRFGIATILLFIVFKIRKQNFLIDKSDKIMFLILGALVIPINQVFFLEGISLSSASHSGIIYSCTPLFAYIISIIMKSDKFYYKKLFTIILTITGIFFVFYDNFHKTNFDNANLIIGDLMLIGAVASWAAYLTLSEPLTKKYGALKTSTISFITGMIMYILIFIYDFNNLTFDKLTPTGILGFFHLSILMAFGAYFVFTYSSNFISVSSLTTYLNSSPIVTIIFSWILLNEEISYFFIIGSVITLAGVFLAQYYRNDKMFKTKYEVIKN